MHDSCTRATQVLVTSTSQIQNIVPSPVNPTFQHGQHRFNHHQHPPPMLQEQHPQNYHHQQQQQLQQHNQQTTTVTPENHFIWDQPCISTRFTASHVSSEEEFEDIDEDQISDLDEEEKNLRLVYEQYLQNFHQKPDVTSQLLEFASVVSADIKKFFGRTTNHDDACDVYKDKWMNTKSGRELYYADLVRIARGDDEPVRKTKKNTLSSLSSSSSSSLSSVQDTDKKYQFSGKRDASVGIGPFTELFEYGLQNFLHKNTKLHYHNPLLRSEISNCNNQRSRIVPMHERNFPDSFWLQPSEEEREMNHNYSHRLDISQQSTPKSSKLPDFSDLMESWQGGVEAVNDSFITKS